MSFFSVCLFFLKDYQLKSVELSTISDKGMFDGIKHVL